MYSFLNISKDEVKMVDHRSVAKYKLTIQNYK